MKKRLGYVILAFGFLVMADYCITMAQIFFSGLSLFPAHASTVAYTSQSGLTSIDFSLFDKGGKGWSQITQGYGTTPYSSIYPGNWHDGIDIAAAYGAPIYSPNDGIVVATGNQDDYCYRKAFGKYVAVKDPVNGLILWYAHLGTISVSPNQTITKGTLLGSVGATGLETGTHLHFSIFDANTFTMTARDGCGPEPTGQDLNPLRYLGTTYQ